MASGWRAETFVAKGHSSYEECFETLCLYVSCARLRSEVQNVVRVYLLTELAIIVTTLLRRAE